MVMPAETRDSVQVARPPAPPAAPRRGWTGAMLAGHGLRHKGGHHHHHGSQQHPVAQSGSMGHVTLGPRPLGAGLRRSSMSLLQRPELARPEALGTATRPRAVSLDEEHNVFKMLLARGLRQCEDGEHLLASKSLDQAERLGTRIYGPCSYELARVHIAQGEVCVASGDHHNALTRFMPALGFAEEMLGIKRGARDWSPHVCALNPTLSSASMSLGPRRGSVRSGGSVRSRTKSIYADMKGLPAQSGDASDRRSSVGTASSSSQAVEAPAFRRGSAQVHPLPPSAASVAVPIPTTASDGSSSGGDVEDLPGTAPAVSRAELHALLHDVVCRIARAHVAHSDNSPKMSRPRVRANTAAAKWYARLVSVSEKPEQKFEANTELAQCHMRAAQYRAAADAYAAAAQDLIMCFPHPANAPSIEMLQHKCTRALALARHGSSARAAFAIQCMFRKWKQRRALRRLQRHVDAKPGFDFGDDIDMEMDLPLEQEPAPAVALAPLMGESPTGKDSGAESRHHLTANTRLPSASPEIYKPERKMTVNSFTDMVRSYSPPSSSSSGGAAARRQVLTSAARNGAGVPVRDAAGAPLATAYSGARCVTAT